MVAGLCPELSDVCTSWNLVQGPQYWRFENGMVDQGYPKLVSTGFDGLQGQITAALSVPEYRRRGEAVYFFKSGKRAEQCLVLGYIQPQY